MARNYLLYTQHDSKVHIQSLVNLVGEINLFAKMSDLTMLVHRIVLGKLHFFSSAHQSSTSFSNGQFQLNTELSLSSLVQLVLSQNSYQDRTCWQYCRPVQMLKAMQTTNWAITTRHNFSQNNKIHHNSTEYRTVCISHFQRFQTHIYDAST